MHIVVFLRSTTEQAAGFQPSFQGSKMPSKLEHQKYLGN